MKKYNVYDTFLCDQATGKGSILVGTIKASDHKQAIQKAKDQFKLQYLYLEVV